MRPERPGIASSLAVALRLDMQRVEAENPLTGEARHTNSVYLTMVALDDDGRPTPVPAVAATTTEEQRRMGEAETRRANRLDERAEIEARRAAEQTGSERPGP